MKKNSKSLRIIRRTIVTLAAVASVIVVAAIIMYHSLFLTAFSVKRISGEQAYTAKLHGIMYFDEFMKTGANNSKELETFIYNKLSLNLYGKLKNKHGCSAFYAKTPEGDILLCSDIDTQKLSEKEKSPVVSFLNLGKKTMEISNIGILLDASDGLNIKEKLMFNTSLYFACNGMNEDGLATALATAAGSTCKNTDKLNLYDSTITTAILSNTSSVEEAINFLKKYDVVADYPLSHYMIADAKGNVAVVEWIDGEMAVLYPEENYMIMTNFPLSSMVGFGIDRYASYENALRKCNGVLTENDALKLLAENVIPGDECWSVVYNLTDRTATVCFRANYNSAYTYSIK